MRTLQTWQTTLATALCFTSTLAVLGLLRHSGQDGAQRGPQERARTAAHEGARTGVCDGSVDLDMVPPPRASLAGRLLVASPSLDDGYFAGTVIYLLADSDHGAIGVVLNRPRDHEEQQDIALWDGGPVGRARVFVLHDDLADADSTRIGDVAVAADPGAMLEEMFAGRGPPSRGKSARVFVGYAGWGAGQLDREIAQGAWRTAPADPRLLLSSDTATLTTSAYQQLAVIR